MLNLYENLTFGSLHAEPSYVWETCAKMSMGPFLMQVLARDMTAMNLTVKGVQPNDLVAELPFMQPLSPRVEKSTTVDSLGEQEESGNDGDDDNSDASDWISMLSNAQRKLVGLMRGIIFAPHVL